MRQLDVQSFGASRARVAGGQETDGLRLRTATLAHDLRTALSALVSGLETLLDDPGISVTRARFLFRVARRNMLLLTDLLDGAAPELEGPTRLERHPVDLRAVTNEVIALLAPVLQERKQRVEIVASARGAVVRANRGHLYRILLNLLDNASKYGPDDDVLRVVIRRRGHGVVVSVCDHGPRIPRGKRRAIFRAFYRLRDSGRPGSGGSGLGLALVRALVDEHGGGVGVSEGLGETRVWFYLPDDVGGSAAGGMS